MGACGLGPQSCPRIPLKGGEEPGERGFCILCLVSRTTRDPSVPLEMGAKTRGQLAFGALSPELMGSGGGGGVQSRAGRGSGLRGAEIWARRSSPGCLLGLAEA